MAEDDSFVPIDWSDHLDIAECLSAVPADATVRGMFFSLLGTQLVKAGHDVSGLENRVAFKAYPTRDYLQLLCKTATTLHPEQPIRHALRQLGQEIYPAFSSSIVGTAIFSVANQNFRRVAKLAPKAYSAAYSPGYIEVEFVSKGRIEVAMTNIWCFADCLQVGIWEGSMKVCGAIGEIQVQRHSQANTTLLITWDE